MCLFVLQSLGRLILRHWPSRGHVVGPPLQLQPAGGSGPPPCLDILALCFDKIWPMFGMHLYDTFTVPLLSILCRVCVGGKQVSIIFRNLAPMEVDTLAEYGGLNHVTLLLRVFLLVLVAASGSKLSAKSYPLAYSTSWYGGTASLKTSSLAEILLNLWLTAAGRFFVMQGGWLLFLFTYMGLSIY